MALLVDFKRELPYNPTITSHLPAYSPKNFVFLSVIMDELSMFLSKANPSTCTIIPFSGIYSKIPLQKCCPSLLYHKFSFLSWIIPSVCWNSLLFSLLQPATPNIFYSFMQKISKNICLYMLSPLLLHPIFKILLIIKFTNIHKNWENTIVNPVPIFKYCTILWTFASLLHLIHFFF